MDGKITALITTIILGFVGWMTRHITNSKKHPCKNDIVFKEVCNSNQKRIEDCVGGEIKNLNQRVTELKTDMMNGFERVERVIKNGRG